MVVCILLLCAGALAAQPEPKYALVETRELPGNHRDNAMFSGLYAARDGTVYIGSSIHGGSAQFYRYDPRADRIEHIAGMAEFLGQLGRGVRVAGKIHTRFVEDREAPSTPRDCGCPASTFRCRRTRGIPWWKRSSKPKEA